MAKQVQISSEDMQDSGMIVVGESWRSVPSPSAAFRFLSAIHDGEQCNRGVERKVLIPILILNEYLRGLAKVNQGMPAFMQKRAS